jgi:hypothetical protein
MAEMTETDRRGIIPRTFTDANGKKWAIELNFEVYRRVFANCDVDLCDIVFKEQKSLKQLANPVTLVDVLWEIVAEQAVKAGIDERDFARCLDLRAVDEAQEKLLDEMLFFSRSRPQAKGVEVIWHGARKKFNEGIARFEKEFPEIKAKLIQEMEKWDPFAPGEPLGNSLESLESIPESGPYGNSLGPQSESKSSGGTIPPVSSHKRRKQTAIRSTDRRHSTRKSSTRSRKGR